MSESSDIIGDRHWISVLFTYFPDVIPNLPNLHETCWYDIDFLFIISPSSLFV